VLLALFDSVGSREEPLTVLLKKWYLCYYSKKNLKIVLLDNTGGFMASIQIIEYKKSRVRIVSTLKGNDLELERMLLKKFHGLNPMESREMMLRLNYAEPAFIRFNYYRMPVKLRYNSFGGLNV